MTHSKRFFGFVIFVFCFLVPKPSLAQTPSPTDSNQQLIAKKNLYFPNQEDYQLKRKVNFKDLLKDYLTPYLKARRLWNYEANLPANTVAIRFNHPMVSKDEVGKEKRTGPWSFVPYRAGVYRWVDQKTLSFTPDKVWQREEVKGLVASSIQSLNGYRFLEPFSYKFHFYGDRRVGGKYIHWDVQIGEPRFVAMQPWSGNTLGTKEPIQMVFDQPVLVDYLNDKMKLLLRKNGEKEFRPVSFTLKHPKNYKMAKVEVDPAYVISIHAKKAYPLDSEVKVVFSKGIKDTNEVTALFQTPSFLKLRKVSCLSEVRCQINETVTPQNKTVTIDDATGLVRLQFNNPVDKEALKYLTILPKPKNLKIDGWDKTVLLRWDWNPSTQYKISFAKGFQSKFGIGLESKLEVHLKTGNRLPAIRFPIGLKTIAKDQVKALDLQWLNLNNVILRSYTIDDQSLPKFLGYFLQEETEKIFATPNFDQDPEIISIPNKGINNQWQTSVLSTQDLLNRGGGVFLIQYETHPFLAKEAEEAKKLELFLQITNIGLTTKVIPNGVMVMTTSMADGKPLAGVDVSVGNISGAILAKGKTDAQGIVFFTEKNHPKIKDNKLIIARQKKDLAFVWIGKKALKERYYELNSNRKQSRYYDDFNSVNKKSKTYKGSLFTDRGVYKPGHKLYLKGVVRNKDLTSNAFFAGKKLDLEIIKKPRYAYQKRVPLVKEEILLSQKGSFDWQWDIPKSTKMDSYEIRLLDDKEIITQVDFLLADAKKANFKVDIRSHQKAKIDQPWQLDVSSAYYFGTPLSNAKMSWQLFRAVQKFKPKGFDDYVFDADTNRFSYYYYDDYYPEDQEDMSEVESNVGQLSGQGKALIEPVLSTKDLEKTSQPLKFLFQATVADPAASSISKSIETIVHPVDFYLGQKTNTYLKSSQEVEFEWVALTPKGKALNDIKAQAVLTKMDRHGYWESGLKGSYYLETEKVDKEVARCTVVSNQKKQGCSLGKHNPGFYALNLVAKDSQAKVVYSRQVIYISGYGAVSNIKSKEFLIKGHLDKEEYTPNEVAKLNFTNPFKNAQLTITVENQGLLHHETHTVKQGLVSLPLKIKPEYAPNAFIGLHLTAGPEASKIDGQQKLAATFRTGYLPLNVQNTTKEIKIKVTTDKKRYRPKEPVTIDLTATDYNQQPLVNSELTVYVVDEGALALSQYQTPQLLSFFYPRHQLEVMLEDNRAHHYGRQFELAIGSMMEKYQIMGDGAVPAKSRLAAMQTLLNTRKDFAETIYWNPKVVTDAKGRATLEFHLRDSTTQYRVMVVGHDGDKLFGSAETQFKTSLPLFVDPVLPQFLIQGDKVFAKILVQNTTDKDQKVTVRLEKPKSETKEITVKPNSTQTVSFQLEAAANQKQMEVIARIEHPEFKDRIEKKIPIHENFLTETHQVAGILKKQKQKLVIQEPASFLSKDQIKLEISNLPVAQLDASLRYLMRYPYGCIEQTSSGIFALLSLQSSVGELLEKSKQDQQELNFFIKGGIERIKSMKVDQSGLSYWPGGKEPHPFGSAYAHLVLVQAQELGFEVDFLSDVTWYLQQQVNKEIKSTKAKKSYHLDSISFMVYSLLQKEKNQSDALSYLFKNHREMNVFGLSFLALSFAEVNQMQQAQVVLQTLLDSYTEKGRLGNYQSYSQLFSSPLRSKALSLEALLAIDAKNDLIKKLVEDIFKAQKNGRWRSTQETAFALRALGKYLQSNNQAKLPSFDLTLNQKTIDRGSFKKKNPLVSFLDFDYKNSELVLQNPTKDPLYFSLIAKVNKSFGFDNNFAINKGIYLYPEVINPQGQGGHAAKVQEFKLGEVYHYRVYVKVEETINNFYLDYPVAAGLIPIDQKLKTTQKQYSKSKDDDDGDRRRDLVKAGLNRIEHFEIRADRVLFFAEYLPKGLYAFDFYARAGYAGNFIQAPATAGGMYTDDVFAREPAVKITVKDK